MKKSTDKMPTIGSIWFDNDEGCGHLYKYKGIDNSELGGGRMHFVRVDFTTGKESEGGAWLGHERFLQDMVSADNSPKHPCCGHPAQYPSVWCDDCGYEKWSAASDAEANRATA